MRAGDGQLVEEHQELAEGLEEGPAGEQTDAFIGVHRPVGDHLLLHRGENTQLDLLLLAQQLHWIWLVELDGRSVHLRPEMMTDHFWLPELSLMENTSMHINDSSLNLTFSPEEMVKTNVEKTGRGSRVFGAQHSILAPMGKQNRGTDSDRGKDS